jgi:hypothetical protein
VLLLEDSDDDISDRNDESKRGSYSLAIARPVWTTPTGQLRSRIEQDEESRLLTCRGYWRKSREWNVWFVMTVTQEATIVHRNLVTAKAAGESRQERQRPVISAESCSRSGQ